MGLAMTDMPVAQKSPPSSLLQKAGVAIPVYFVPIIQGAGIEPAWGEL